MPNARTDSVKTGSEIKVGETPCVSRVDTGLSQATSGPGDAWHRPYTYAICLVLPLVFLLAYWIDRPFATVIASKTVSLSSLSGEQRLNIQNAAHRIQGTVLKPNEEFSFNRVVGPRTSRSGFLPAPAYVGNDSPKSIGGGICLLSSALYQTALSSGMAIVERIPHLRTIRSIAAGLDSTVWYGADDLRFRNTLDCPIEIVTKYSPYEITVELRGNTHIKNWQPAQISRHEQQRDRDHIYVEVTAKQFGKTKLVSQDIYGIPTSGERHR